MDMYVRNQILEESMVDYKTLVLIEKIECGN